MGESIAVSVILPVYNVAPYIGRCIESLQAQTLSNLEFIFVDDCSTDGSMDAVEAWAAQDGRVRAFYNEENLGAGPSRNRGIEMAHGEYLSFVDPDDWVGDDFYELLYRNSLESNCEVSKGLRVRVDTQANTEMLESDMNTMIVRDVEQGKPLYLNFRYGHQSALYRHSLFDDNEVRYGTSRNCQDVTFLLIACSRARTIGFENRARYYYRFGREDAATSKYTADRSLRELDSLEQRIDYLLTLESSDYWYEYLLVPFCAYPSRMYLALKNEGPNPDKEALYVHRMTEQLHRIPDYQRLLDELPELDALVRHGAIIPSRKHESNIGVRVQLEEWVAFLELQPTLENPYKKACSFAAVDCLMDGLRGGDSRYPYVRQQLGRLSPRWRRQILLGVPGQVAARAYRRARKVLGREP